jgi:hypothetical protein
MRSTLGEEGGAQERFDAIVIAFVAPEQFGVVALEKFLRE